MTALVAWAQLGGNHLLWRTKSIAEPGEQAASRAVRVSCAEIVEVHRPDSLGHADHPANCDSAAANKMASVDDCHPHCWMYIPDV